jgi:hypothetical protein
VKTFWMVLAGVAILVACVFLWRQDFDKAFVAAAIGMVAWFLNYRVQMKAVVAAADLEENNNKYEEETYEDRHDDGAD